MVLYTVIVRPKGPSNLGGRIAAPVIREAADAIIDYTGILRGRNPAVPHSGTIVLPEAPAAPFISDIMPDLRGYSKRQLLPLLMRDDLVISMDGEGYVARQSPPPGSKIAPDTHIYLELE
jgi:cell division protein FtsI (penicillin-binding protein 3)